MNNNFRKSEHTLDSFKETKEKLISPNYGHMTENVILHAHHRKDSFLLFKDKFHSFHVQIDSFHVQQDSIWRRLKFCSLINS